MDDKLFKSLRCMILVDRNIGFDGQEIHWNHMNISIMHEYL